MTADDPRAVWQGLLEEQPGVQRRFEGHPLRLHYGTDEVARPILLLRLDTRPETLELGKAVSVEVRERPGQHEWTMVIRLLDRALTDTFVLLCIDLAERSALADDEPGALRLFHRALRDFKDLLLRGIRRPSLEVIRGLVAELWVALRLLAPRLGADGAVLAWGGPLGAAHDFRDPDDALFEVKAIHAESRSVTISSVNQLDPIEPSPLTLVTVALEERPEGTGDAVSVGSLTAEFRDALLVHPGMVGELDRRLAALGFDPPDPDNERHFAVVGSRRYAVGQGFPRIMRGDVPSGIDRVTYQIAISSMGRFEIVDPVGPGLD